MPGKKGMVHYPVNVKLEAIRLFYEEGKTQAEITKTLGIRSDNRVEVWLRQYRREGEIVFTRPIGRPRKVNNEVTRIKQLEMENALLKKFHTELRKSLLAKRNIGSSITTRKNTK
ncbi:MAG: helix-turn-helix domain-containing protein [Chloroflexota bacterium]